MPPMHEIAHLAHVELRTPPVAPDDAEPVEVEQDPVEGSVR